MAEGDPIVTGSEGEGFDVSESVQGVDPDSSVKEANGTPEISEKWLKHNTELFEEMARQCKEGNDQEVRRIRDEIYESNKNLAHYIAKLYISRMPRGMTLEDLESEACIGLIVAIDEFDLNRGLAFSTLAGKCIKNAIRNALRVYSDRGGMDVSRFYLLEQAARGDGAELLKRLAKNIRNRPRNKPLPEEQIKILAQNEYDLMLNRFNERSALVQFDPKNSDSFDYSDKGQVMRSEEKDVFEIIFSSLSKENLTKALEILTPEERLIIDLVFGLEGKDATKMDDIGKLIEGRVVTRQRIFQIYKKALAKLLLYLEEHGQSFADLSNQ